MKKNILAAAFFIVLLSSCKKDYTCTCTYNAVSNNYQIYDTKAKATSSCDDRKANGVDCVLK